MRKKQTLVALLALVVLGSHVLPAQACIFRCLWRKRCMHQCTMNFSCTPYNAFTPVCFGNMCCTGCAPFCAPPCGLYSGCCSPDMSQFCCPPSCCPQPCCDGFACAGPANGPYVAPPPPMVPQAPPMAPVAPTFTPPAPTPLNQTMAMYQQGLPYGLMQAGYVPNYGYPGYMGYYPVPAAQPGYYYPGMNYGYGYGH